MGNGNGELKTGLEGLQGDGKTEMALWAEGGRVIIRYPMPMLWVAFDPSNAVAIGKKIIDCAVECGARVTIAVPRRQISEQKHQALIARAMHVIRSQQEKHRRPEVVARNVVDSIIAAIE